MTAPAIASRASWGARRPDGDLTLSGLASEVFIHHTVSAHLAPSASVDAERAQVRAVEDVGWRRFGPSHGISYNLLIFPSGRAYQGVSWNRRGAHTGGRNSTSRGIAFVGNYETTRPTDAAILTARRIVAHGRGRWWTNNAAVRGHRAVSATACPGRFVMDRLSEIATAPPAIRPPSGDPVPDLSNFSMHNAQRFNRGSWGRLRLANDGRFSVITGRRRFIGTLSLTINGLPAGREFQVRPIRVVGDSWTNVDARFNVEELVGTPGKTLAVATVAGSLGANHRLRFEVQPFGADVTVERVNTRFLSWPI